MRYSGMLTSSKLFFMGLVVLISGVVLSQSAPVTSPRPEYTKDSGLKFPEHYREWIYLTTGFDMSYNPPMQMADHHTFDNVFVNPEAYKTFTETGTWPDKTIFVLELRGAKSKGSINQNGNYQSTEITGFDVHVKDEKRFPGSWAFFGFDPADTSKSSKMIPVAADCYSCHAAHAAVDNTFVQFYPTLLPIATRKGTLSANYLKDLETQK